MKKILIGLTFSAFLLGACSDNADNQDNTQAGAEGDSQITELEERIAELEEENDALRTEESEASSSATPTPDEEEISEQEDPNEIIDTEAGTRSNPVPFGETLSLVGSVGANDFTFSITLTETIRGSEAWNIIHSENQFNDEPGDGQEYIMNKVKIDLLNSSDVNASVDFSYREFDHFTNSGSNYQSTFPLIPNRLDFEIFEGGVAEGYIAQIISTDDSPVIRYGDTFFFESE